MMIQWTSPNPAPLPTHTPKTLKQSQEWDHAFGKSHFSIWKPIPIDPSRAFPTELGNLVQKGDAQNQYEVFPSQFRMSLLWYILGYWLYWRLTPVSHIINFSLIVSMYMRRGSTRTLKQEFLDCFPRSAEAIDSNTILLCIYSHRQNTLSEFFSQQTISFIAKYLLLMSLVIKMHFFGI